MSLSDVACLPFTIISILIAVSVLNLKTRFDMIRHPHKSWYRFLYPPPCSGHCQPYHGYPWAAFRKYSSFSSLLLSPSLAWKWKRQMNQGCTAKTEKGDEAPLILQQFTPFFATSTMFGNCTSSFVCYYNHVFQKV